MNKKVNYIKRNQIGWRTVFLFFCGVLITVFTASVALAPPFTKREVQSCPATVAFGGTSPYTYTAKASVLLSILIWLTFLTALVLTISLAKKHSRKYKILTSLVFLVLAIAAVLIDFHYFHIC